MDNTKQKLLIEYLISSTDTFAICDNIVQPEFFDPEYRNALDFIKKYYNTYSTTPQPDQILAETGMEFTIRTIKKDQIAYCTSEIETFCKRRALEKAILNSPKHINDENYDQVLTDVRNAILLSLQKDLGVRYYDDVQERLDRMLNENPTHPTGWSEVDDLLFGGISRKEMLLVSANSGGGKSITLSNLAFNFSHSNRNVLYVSLELSEDVIAQRFDTMHTGISRKDWKSHISEIVTRVNQEKVGSGIIDIVQMSSGTTANAIKGYLKEYYLHYSMLPDLLIVDYLDKMGSNERIDLSDVFTKDKLCSEQLRDIGVEYNMYTATASQLNRSAVGATNHDHSQIAGGISKINECDVYWSIIFTDAMRAAGEMSFVFQKTRNSDGVGNTVHLKWDPVHLRILNQNDSSSSALKFNSKKTNSDILDIPSGSGQSLLDLMST
jgi:replicative DNA helicase